MTPTVAPSTEKICRYGNHVINESDRGGFTTFYHTDADGNPDKPDEYACAKHDKEQRVKEFKATKVLTTRLMTEAYLDQNDRMRALGLTDGNYHPTTKLWFDDFVAECDAVGVAAKRWEREVWFGGQFPDLDDEVTKSDDGLLPRYRTYRNKKTGLPKGSLQAFVIPAQYKGYRADVGAGDSGGPRTYLSYTMCGRSIFQIDDDVNDVSVGIILDEDSPSARGGIKSIHATGKQAIALIQRAVSDWQAGLIKWEHKDGVGFGF